MKAVDTKRRKAFHKRTNRKNTFQDVARLEMAKENRRSFKRGVESRKGYIEKMQNIRGKKKG